MAKETSKGQTYKIDWVAIFVSVAILAALVVFTIAVPDKLESSLTSVRNVLIYKFGWYYIVFTFALLVYCIYLAFSKYGSIRMGRTKPEYSTFGWVAMIFCAAMGLTILFWSAVEWAYYIVWLQPFGYSMEETAEITVSYSLFHWGPVAWAIYAGGVIPVAYRYYVRKKPGLTLQGACEGVLGEKRAHGALGTVISIIFVFGVLGGYAISYGTGIPMLSNFLHHLVGTPENLLVAFLLVAAITAVFMWSACSGIAKGIQVLSKLCVVLCFVTCAAFLVLGHTQFIVDNTVQSFGYHFQNFFRMMFYVDPTGASGGFPQEWTVFYWAWWIGLAPVMWVFIAKCSAGRSIREIILWTLVSGFVATLMFFGTISNQGLGEAILGGFDWANIGSNGTILDTFYNTYGEFDLVSDVIFSLPFGKGVLVVWFVNAFFLFVTTMDSASYTMAAACTKGLAVNDDPKTPFRVLFACLLSVTPLCLICVGSSLTGFKAVLIITSFLVSILDIFALVSCQKWIMQDFGKWTADEIRIYFSEYVDELNEERGGVPPVPLRQPLRFPDETAEAKQNEPETAAAE